MNRLWNTFRSSCEHCPTKMYEWLHYIVELLLQYPFSLLACIANKWPQMAGALNVTVLGWNYLFLSTWYLPFLTSQPALVCATGYFRCINDTLLSPCCHRWLLGWIIEDTGRSQASIMHELPISVWRMFLFTFNMIQLSGQTHSSLVLLRVAKYSRNVLSR